MTDAFGRKANSYKHSPNTSTEYSRFNSEYFAGSDIRIYFGDIWVDEITSLQFTLQEQVAPIFGYASYTWDKVARGNRYIQGSFAINFKESYYLHSVLNSLSSKMRTESSTNPTFDATKWKEGISVEHLVSASGGGTFDTLAREFENSLWGAGNNKKIAKSIKRQDKDTYFYPEHRGKNDEMGGATYDNETSQKALAENGFNIIIGYGPMHEARGTVQAKKTAQTLIGVQLTGVSQVIGGDGHPIQEQYSFIAKDLNGDVTVAPTGNYGTSGRTSSGGGGGGPARFEQ